MSIKVLIIDQSISVCNLMKNIIVQQESMEVVGVTTEMNEAIELLISTSPDVVLLDVNMPTKNKKNALEQILETKLIPVIMLSANTVKQTARTVKAMSNGAVDFMKKDSGIHPPQKHYEQEVITKIIQANEVKHIRPSLKNEKNFPNEVKESSVDKVNRNVRTSKKASLIAIGTSTGGPRALQRILEDLPKGFTVPILIVQHMPAKFTSSLATRLNNIGNVRVKEAIDGETVKKGTAYIAPGNFHMIVNEHAHGLKIALHQEEEYFGHRPSVNVLFNSLANLHNVHKIAVVLTGMGKDGAEGVQQIKRSESDAIIIAESNETAIIDGMPSATIATNVVTEIIRLDDIGDALVEYAK